MKTEQTLTPNESLEIIGKMVDQARFNFSKHSFYFIMWGVLLLSAAVFEIVSKHLGFLEFFWAGWPIAGMVGGLLSTFQSRKISKQLKHETHIDRMYGLIWVFYFVTLFVMLLALVRNHMEPSGYIMVMTGLPTILTGKLIRFKPLVFGGVSFWIFGTLALFVLPEFATPLFIVSMITGYLIPGFMMRNVKNA